MNSLEALFFFANDLANSPEGASCLNSQIGACSPIAIIIISVATALLLTCVYRVINGMITGEADYR